MRVKAIVVISPEPVLVRFHHTNGMMKQYYPTDNSYWRLCKVVNGMINNHMQPWQRPQMQITPLGFQAEW